MKKKFFYNYLFLLFVFSYVKPEESEFVISKNSLKQQETKEDIRINILQLLDELLQCNLNLDEFSIAFKKFSFIKIGNCIKDADSFLYSKTQDQLRELENDLKSLKNDFDQSCERFKQKLSLIKKKFKN